MNILMISDVYFPRVNGVSTSIATFRKALAAHGHSSCLIAPDYGRGQEGDGNVLRIPSRYLFLDPEDRIMKSRRIYALEKELDTQQFDLLHIQTPFVAHHTGLRLARRLRIPAIETYHTYFEQYLFHYIPFVPRTVMKRLARRFTRCQCNRTQAVVTPSRAMQAVLNAYGVRAPTAVIPTGIEPEEFMDGSRQRFCVAHGICPERPVLVHIGRIAHEKNIGFLLETLCAVREQVPDVLLVIAGEGPARRRLQQHAARLGLQDHTLFIGYLPRGPALWDCYRAGDVFVFASATETQGLVLLEAMALGVPLVSTAVMGTRDILEAGRGALVAEETTQDFAGKVIRLLRDPALRERLGREGREYVHTWSAQSQARRLAGLYLEVIARFNRG